MEKPTIKQTTLFKRKREKHNYKHINDKGEIMIEIKEVKKKIRTSTSDHEGKEGPDFPFHCKQFENGTT